MSNTSIDKIFEALASTPRRKILAYLSEAELTAGDIATRFEMSKPALSQHLRVLEHAGLVASERRGQFIWYRLVPDNLTNTLMGFASSVCPVGSGLKRESMEIKAARNAEDETGGN